MIATIPRNRGSILVLAIVCLIGIDRATARPARTSSKQQIDHNVPKLSETLAVAKSPLEPITMAPMLPDARNNELLSHGEPSSTTTREDDREDAVEAHKQTTRQVAADHETSSFSEQEAARTTRSFDGSATPLSLETTTTVIGEAGSTEGGDDSATTTTTHVTSESPITTTATDSNKADEPQDEGPATTTSSTEAPISPSSLAPSSESFPKLDGSNGDGNFKGASSMGQNVSLVSEEPSPSSSTQTAEPPSSSTTTTTTTTEAATTTTEAATTTTEATTTTTEATATMAATTAAPTTTTTQAPETEPPSIVVLGQKEQPVGTTETPTTTTTTTTTTTPAPTTTTPEPETTPTIPKTTTPAPTEPPTEASSTTTTTAPVETTQKSTTTTTTATTTTTTAPVNLESDNRRPQVITGCNHLPTYDTDEIQKVFREETTYRNGTIKGKFTYINFDQRYRLVHYTRLPYGPVKIDVVEELGKPEQQASANANNQSTPTISEVPNAVLQLRNLLPTSLFGFPFLGPHSSGQLGPIVGPTRESGGDEDRSNMYFYSTDTLATPNLLTPRVPVSLLPGQRLKQTAASQPDIARNIGDSPVQSYFEQSLVARPQLVGPPANPIAGPSVPDAQLSLDKTPKRLVADQRNQESLRQHASQYSYPRTLVYDYLDQSQLHQPVAPAYHHQYQYPSSASTMGFSLEQQQQPNHHGFPHQYHHQPHAHEHYVAPFMFVQSPAAVAANNGELGESSRLRLKVKTAKALQHPTSQQGIKSAQLRQQNDGLYSQPANSPMQQHRYYQQPRAPKAQPRQRLGKQNHDLKTNTNSLPVVYHVLRNPAGRTFTMPHTSQGYAIAYDHDD